MIDLTILFTGLTIIGGMFFSYKLSPLFKSIVPTALITILQKVARYVVYSAEAEIGNGKGQDKFDLALTRAQAFFERYRITFDKESIKAAILEQWLQMNLEQVRSGMKRNR